ncbi:Cullin family-domain-containing protein [Cyathus striatus]|nr:Cullin family-domain-containing protein [Cyathus striatus]
MTSLVSLLTLPKTSKGLTQLRTSVVQIDDGSASPRRKVARLHADSDSASASRYKSVPNKTPGPITIHIDGDYAPLLQRSIRVILDRQSTAPPPWSYEAIYSACRTIVTEVGTGEGLYDTLKIEVERCVDRLAKDLAACTNTGVPRLAYFIATSKWFGKQVALLQSLLTYLDQVYVKDTKGLKSIHNLAFLQFSVRIFEHPTIAENLREDVKDWATWERTMRLEHDQRDIIPSLIQQLHTHQQYAPFEHYYAEITRAFYEEESAELGKSLRDHPKEFLSHVKQRIKEENQRSQAVLPVGSWALVRKVTERSLWNGRLEWVGGTLGPYMDERDLDNLDTLYSLFSRVEGTKILCDVFRKHIRFLVQKIVADESKDDEMVPRLLALKAFADKAIAAVFVDEKPAAPSTTNNHNNHGASTSTPCKVPNQEFIYALSDAFTMGFKARRNKPAEMIAKHLDKLMRKGQGAMSDVEFESMLDAALALYRFTDDKDVFRTFYHRSLAKRLLLEKSASDDFEAAMLKKLKEKYDPEFGMGEDMFKDLALSREMMKEYHSKLAEDDPGRKLHVMVLQRSAWPFTVRDTSVDLPPNMQHELSKYAAQYKEKHSGHVLYWDHALGTATLKARFKEGIKELSVSLYQAVVLLLFNESPEMPFKEILAQTRMEDGELRRTLQSLACGKKKVLKKFPSGRNVNDDDMFRFNADFEDERAKVHINSIQAKVSPEESRRTNISIEGDRKHYLDAAIVRIMKAKKELTYEQLKAATIDAVKNHFVPSVDVIKKRIDSLVESDYLERSKGDRNKFLYVA